MTKILVFITEFVCYLRIVTPDLVNYVCLQRKQELD